MVRIRTAVPVALAFLAGLASATLVPAALAQGRGGGTLTELPVRTPLQPHAVVWSDPGHLITSQRTAAGGTLIKVTADGSTPPEVLWQLPSRQRWLDPAPDVGPGGRIVFTVRSDVSQDLLLVADDGFVHNLAGTLQAAGDIKAFKFGMQKADGPRHVQLLIAIVGAKPLEALKTAQLGSADQVFAQLLAEALQSGQSRRPC